MTANSSFHRRYRAEQLLIEARRKMIWECCRSHPLKLKPSFYRHGGVDFAVVPFGGVELEIHLADGYWNAWGALVPSCGTITGTRENFLLVLEKVFPERNMRGA